MATGPGFWRTLLVVWRALLTGVYNQGPSPPRYPLPGRYIRPDRTGRSGPTREEPAKMATGETKRTGRRRDTGEQPAAMAFSDVAGQLVDGHGDNGDEGDLVHSSEHPILDHPETPPRRIDVVVNISQAMREDGAQAIQLIGLPKDGVLTAAEADILQRELPPAVDMVTHLRQQLGFRS